MKIADLDRAERPREKMRRLGVRNLTNAELDPAAVAPGVVVRNLSIGDSLMTLCYEMK